MTDRKTLGHSLDFNGGRKCLLQQSSSFLKLLMRPSFLSENMGWNKRGFCDDGASTAAGLVAGGQLGHWRGQVTCPSDAVRQQDATYPADRGLARASAVQQELHESLLEPSPVRMRTDEVSVCCDSG